MTTWAGSSPNRKSLNMTIVNVPSFERITRSLRRGTGKRDLQDVALSSLGFCTLGELEDHMADASEAGTSLLRRQEFRQ
jgi:hypothetical protein